jgi:hypothetical protein
MSLENDLALANIEIERLKVRLAVLVKAVSPLLGKQGYEAYEGALEKALVSASLQNPLPR